MSRETILTDELLTAHIDKYDKMIRKLAELHARGLMTESELNERLEKALFEGFFDFLRENGGMPDDTAAPDIDKTGFFRLMTAFHLPAAYFEPVPENVTVPEWIPGHFGGQKVIGAGKDAYWLSDGGLTESPDPVGRTFVLKDRLGLQTTFTVSRAEADRYDDTCMTYSGKGVIEGYFSPREREMSVTSRGSRILFMTAFEEGPEDALAYESFPLWQEYHAWGKHKQMLREEALQKCRGGLLKSMPKKFDVICVGMALVDSIIKGFDPEPVSASGFRAVSGSLHVGGEAVNEAMACAKLGMKTGIMCALGKDEAGELVLGALERCGVCTDPVICSGEHATPVTTMFVHEDGSRKSITNEAHRYNFHPERFVSQLTGAKALILGSMFRAPFDDPEIIGAVLKAAKAAEQIVFADTKLPNFRKLTLEDLREFLPFIDYLTPNEDEAAYYSGETEPEAMADVFLSYGVKNVIIKLGASGCLLKNAEMTLKLPGHQVDAVDATGAGDNFVAGFASEILRGSSPERALEFANWCGAICTTAVGAATALKSREQVLDAEGDRGRFSVS